MCIAQFVNNEMFSYISLGLFPVLYHFDKKKYTTTEDTLTLMISIYIFLCLSLYKIISPIAFCCSLLIYFEEEKKNMKYSMIIYSKRYVQV